MPGVIDDDEDAIAELTEVLDNAKKQKVKICIRIDENVSLPKALKQYQEIGTYVTTPMTIIDKKIIWFGEPYPQRILQQKEIL